MNKTYHFRTLFKFECEQCKKTIYPGDEYATEYLHKESQRAIDVLEAYNLRTTEKESKTYCIKCKPKPIIN